VRSLTVDVRLQGGHHINIAVEFIKDIPARIDLVEQVSDRIPIRALIDRIFECGDVVLVLLVATVERDKNIRSPR